MIKKINEKDFNSKVLSQDGEIQTDKPVLIDFYADWCKPCDEMLKSLRIVDKEFQNLTIYKMDVEDSKQVVSSLGIRGIPSLYLVGNGKVSVTSGLMPEDKLRDFIDAALN